MRWVLTAVALLTSAGRLDWGRAWVYLCLSLAAQVITLTLLLKTNPELIKRRARAQKNTKPKDLVLLALMFSLFFAAMIAAGLDAGRHHWSAVPWQAGVGGGAGVVLGAVVVAWAMLVNAHFEATVRIQSDRGHQVCTRGPYRIVRHPGYAGIILVYLGAPLLLGSWWALIPACLSCTVLVARTAMEDRTLQRELQGYREFTRQTRYRLAPLIW